MNRTETILSGRRDYDFRKVAKTSTLSFRPVRTPVYCSLHGNKPQKHYAVCV